MKTKLYTARRILLYALAFSILALPNTYYAFAQSNKRVNNGNPWLRSAEPNPIQLNLLSSKTPIDKTAFFTVDVEKLNYILSKAQDLQLKTYLTLPHPEYQFEEYLIHETEVLPKTLITKYPTIRTYRGSNSQGRRVWISTDQKGIHATIESKNGNIYLDALKNTPTIYRCYYKKDATSTAMAWEKEVLEDPQFKQYTFQNAQQRISASEKSNETIREFRIAVATTGEYTLYHGGKVEDALGAVVTAVNRINAVFEREVGVRFKLTENNDRIIFTDPTTDPFTNGDTYELIEENQILLDDSIGTANYDIGHVFFGESFSGLAYVGSICSNLYKAGAASGHPQPDADPFFVDVLCHEIGHQFGAYHSHNASCNRTATSAYEPGSGSTIMAYTGICSPNLQNNSDDYFHAGSIEEILNFLDFINCGEIINSNNVAPNITGMPQEGKSIPANTYFELIADATDANNDKLMYAWDQIDTGPQTDPLSPLGNAPLFRSFPYTESPVRYFPKLSTQLGGQPIFGEILPDYSRELNFRFIARDLNGGTSFKDTKLAVFADAGPFLLNENNLQSSYYFDEKVEITWDVAGTNENPIRCSKVNILISYDNGETFNEMLAANTENDGIETIQIPRTVTQNARIKIKAADNFFYTISLHSFSIEEPPFTINTQQDTLYICGEQDAKLLVNSTSFNSVNENIQLSVENLPDAINISPSTISVDPGEQSEFTLKVIDPTLADTVLKAKVIAQSSDFEFTEDVYIAYSNAKLEGPTLISPLNNLKSSPLRPVFEWESMGNFVTYNIEVSDDALFENVLFNKSNIKNNQLQLPFELLPSTKYFWRVSSSNTCGIGAYKSVNNFTTISIVCEQLSATDLPKTITTEVNSVIISEIEVSQVGTIHDIVIQNINGLHSFINDLKIELISPENVSILLVNQVCSDQDNFNWGFSDTSLETEITCPPTDGKIYKPAEPLATLNGTQSQGIWQLVITDLVAQDGGRLDSWELQLCIEQPDFSLTGSASSFDAISLNWDYSTERIIDFEIERKKADQTNFTFISKAAQNANSFIDTDLEANTTYDYRLKANFQNGQFAYSSTIQVTTLIAPPTAPSGLNYTNKGADFISLIWTDNSLDETNFRVLRTLSNSNNYDTIATLQQNTTSYTDSNLIDDTAYKYIISAVGVNANSYSDTLLVKTNAIPPNKPSNLKTNRITTDEISLSWSDQASNETNYIVLRSSNDNFKVIADLLSNTITFDDANLQENTLYKYIIGAVGIDTIVYSDTLLVKTLTIPPFPADNLSAQNISYNEATITWDDNAINETSYKLLRSNDGDFALVTDLLPNTSSYVDTNLVGNTVYQYKVEAVRIDTSSFSETLFVKTLLAPPAAPTNLQYTNLAPNFISLAWNDNASNEIGYQVLRAISNSNNFETITDLPQNANTFTDSNLLENTTYKYIVSALGADINSFSDTLLVNTSTTPPNKPSNLNTSRITTNEISLLWTDQASNETNYIVLRSNNDNFQVIADLPPNTNTFDDSGLQENTFYKYIIGGQGIDTIVYSDTLLVKTLTIPPLPANNLSAQNISFNKATITWNDNALNESAYKVFRSSGSSFNMVADLLPNTTSFADTGLNSNTMYQYKVEAVRLDTSTFSEILFVKTLLPPPAAPTSIIIEQNNTNEISISWVDNSQNESEYLIIRQTAGFAQKDTLAFTSANTQNYIDTFDIAYNTTYTYFIYAQNEGGSSEALLGAITTLNAPPSKPLNLLINNIEATQFIVSWQDNADNESKFEIEISENDSLNFNTIVTTGKDAASAIIDGLIPETLYFCRVRAVNNGGASDYTTSVPVTTSALVPLAPTYLRFSTVPAKEVQLEWDNTEPKAVAVIIERSFGTNKDFEQIALTNIGASSFTDVDFIPGNQYYYRIASFDGINQSIYSNEIFVSSEVTSNEEQILDGLEIYPNPTNSVLYIENVKDASVKIHQLVLIDVTGKVIMTKEPQNTINQTLIQLNISYLPKGMYFLKINKTKSIKVFKN